jgi:hypothetical protein
MTYVDRIISKFGGIRPLARLIDKPPSTISSWKIKGTIPDKYKPEVLEAAMREELDLKPEHFFPDIDLSEAS